MSWTLERVFTMGRIMNSPMMLSHAPIQLDTIGINGHSLYKLDGDCIALTRLPCVVGRQ